MRWQARDIVLVMVLAAVAVASVADLIMDLSHGVQTAHVVQEALILVAAVLALAWIFNDQRKQRKQISELREELSEAKNQRPVDPRLLQVRQELAGAIADQFETWQLSGSEKEVGLLLLKGLSHKEIALVRGTEEKTVRQQASAIYRKAGLSGRHAFAAWFIEDFL